MGGELKQMYKGYKKGHGTTRKRGLVAALSFSFFISLLVGHLGPPPFHPRRTLPRGSTVRAIFFERNRTHRSREWKLR